MLTKSTDERVSSRHHLLIVFNVVLSATAGLSSGCGKNQSECNGDGCGDGDTSSDTSSELIGNSDTVDSDSETGSLFDSDSETDTDTVAVTTDSTTDDSASVEEPPDTEPLPEGCVIFIDPENGSDGRTGVSWEDAKAGLPSALVAAEQLECTEIWAAAGTYKADRSGDSAYEITLVAGIDVYGGFSGSETVRTERDADTNPAWIESRVLGADDVILDGFRMIEDSSEAFVAEGVTMTLRNCRFLDNGIGIQATDSNLTIDNCIFDGNVIGVRCIGGELEVIDSEIHDSFLNELIVPQVDSGSGINVSDGATVVVENTLIEGCENRGLKAVGAAVTVNDSEFTENNSFRFEGGGGIYAESSQLAISNTSISDSTAYREDMVVWYDGAGIKIEDSTVAIEDSVFERNRTSKGEHYGGAIHAAGSTLSIINTSFFENGAGYGGAIYSKESELGLTDCVFDGNESQYGAVYVYGDGYNTTDVSSCSFTGNTAAEAAGAIYLHATEMKIHGCTFAGNQAGVGGAIVYDGEFPYPVSMIESCVFKENTADSGGAMHSQGNTVIDDCLFEKNHAGQSGVLRMASPSHDCDSSLSNSHFINNNGTAVVISGSMLWDQHFAIRSTLLSGTNGYGIRLLDGNLSLNNVTVVGNSTHVSNSVFGAGFAMTDGNLTVTNSIFFNNPYGTVSSTPLQNVSVTHSRIDEAFEGEGNIVEDPLFVSVPMATTFADSGGTAESVVLLGYSGQLLDGYIIEIDQDGVERTITKIVNEEVFFEPAYSEETDGLRVDIWGASPDQLVTDYHLQPGSPCIDSGTDETVVETIDLDGNPRTIGAAVDMGAFEAQ